MVTFFRETQTLTLTPLQKRICDNIQCFDLCSLLKLLGTIGYKIGDIYFKSNPDQSSHSALCQRIEFSDVFPRVELVLNLGLLSVNSPLPSYFMKKMDAGVVDSALLTRFLGFFDHFMISNLLSMSLPEDNGWFFSDWKETQSQYLNLLALNSTSTIWHLFQICFPELLVNVVKFQRVMSTESAVTVLGSTLLGRECYLGKKEKVTLSSFKILLTTEEVETDQLVHWAIEVKKRLQSVLFPILARVYLYLQVTLELKNVSDVVRLTMAAQLGYRCLGGSSNSLRVSSFAGYTNEFKSERR